MKEINPQERTRHQVKDDRDISKLLEEYKINKGDVLEFESGKRRLVSKVHDDDSITTIYQESVLEGSIGVSGFSNSEEGEWFFGRYYPRYKEFKFKL